MAKIESWRIQNVERINDEHIITFALIGVDKIIVTLDGETGIEINREVIRKTILVESVRIPIGLTRLQILARLRARFLQLKGQHETSEDELVGLEGGDEG